MATGVELIHTATLIHDDVIDEARVRRFCPTLNVTWGDKLSILAGDYLYSKAFFVLSRNLNLSIMQVLASATNKICEGEIEQLRNAYNPNLTEENYLNIIKNKTGALISACCETGAILGEAPDEEVDALSHFGLNIGIAYQIVDDCLDLVKDELELGKEIRNDLKNGKLTLPLIYTMRRLSEEKIKIDPFGRDKEGLIELCKDHEAIDYSINRAMDFVESAKACLQILGDFKMKEMFKLIADYVVEKVAAPKVSFTKESSLSLSNPASINMQVKEARL